MGAGRGASTHGRSATRSNSWARCSPSVGASASMPSVRADAYGLPATTASSDALETYDRAVRSEEHTSELQSRLHLVCRLLLEKKKMNNKNCDQPQTPTLWLRSQAPESTPAHPLR